jgi:hypothetical protein
VGASDVGSICVPQSTPLSPLTSPYLPAALGVRLVLVVGARMQIEREILAIGGSPRIVGGFRVTDQVALQAAIRAAGTARMEVEARLSKVCGCVGYYGCGWLPSCMLIGATLILGYHPHSHP